MPPMMIFVLQLQTDRVMKRIFTGEHRQISFEQPLLYLLRPKEPSIVPVRACSPDTCLA